MTRERHYSLRLSGRDMRHPQAESRRTEGALCCPLFMTSSQLLILHSRCLHLRQLDQEEDDPQTTLEVPYSIARVAVGSFHCRSLGSFHCRSSRLRVVGSLRPVSCNLCRVSVQNEWFSSTRVC